MAPLADWIDLDGHLLIANDPFAGLRLEGGRLLLPEGAGLGVEWARRFLKLLPVSATDLTPLPLSMTGEGLSAPGASRNAWRICNLSLSPLSSHGVASRRG